MKNYERFSAQGGIRENRKIDIAVVGVACRFPDANGYNEFWSNLENGVNSISEISSDRWDIDKYYSKTEGKSNKSISKWCGQIDNIYDFDNQFFNISNRETYSMDPQQRLLMEETWHCIEDSGISLANLQQKVTSVHVGMMNVDYINEVVGSNSDIDSYVCLGNFDCLLANRLSYIFNFTGVSLSINAACASAGVVIHEAKRSLVMGDSDYAIASCVNLNIHPLKYISFSKSRMLSPDGQCKTFDKDANGYVPGDGVGVILLQRKEDAIRDGNRIYGLIKGSAINHGGKGLSITAPRVESQKKLILEAYKDAGISPETVTYVETHGTGTSLGDPIEVEALTQAFRQYTDKNQFCKIGSVKTNIGHLEAAAGMAGTIKVLMMMKNKKIPKTLNINIVNPIIDFERTPFSIAMDNYEWNSKEAELPLRASVSSFGFSGMNTHIILEEYKQEIESVDLLDDTNEIFVLSAKNLKSLKNSLNNWKGFICTEEFNLYRLKDVCLTLLTGRSMFPYRCGVIVSNKDDIKKFVQKDLSEIFENKKSSWGFRIGVLPWNGYRDIEPMLKEFRLFDKKLDEVMVCLDQNLLVNYKDDLWLGQYKEAYLYITGYAYALSIIDLGIKPEVVSGEKLGTWIALTLSGIFKSEDIVDMLLGNKKIEDMELSRPKTPFYDQVNMQKLMPFGIEREYLRDLVTSINLESSLAYEVLVQYVNKARMLYECQYTFKKIINEWDARVKRTTNYDMNEMLFNDSLLSSIEESDKRRRVLLVAVIVCTLREVNKKWSLTENKLLDNPQFYELMDLVTDNVMPKELLVELLISEDTEYNDIVKQLNERQGNINSKNDYRYLKSKNKAIKEINDTICWLKVMISTDVILPNSGDLNCLDLGELARSSTHTTNIKFTGNIDKSFLENLLKMWLMGEELNWELFILDESFRKVELPVYCYERNHFYVSYKKTCERTNRERIEQSTSVSNEVHPLIGRNISTVNESRFVTRLRSEEFYIKDHKVFGAKTFPGVGYLEMVRAGAEIVNNRHVVKMKNIVWLTPITLKCNSREIYTEIFNYKDTMKYKVWTKDHKNKMIEHSIGKLVYEDSEKIFNKFEYLDIGKIKNRCTYRIEDEDVYRLLNDIGLEYGTSFKSIKKIYKNEIEAISFLQLPLVCRDGAKEYVLHPSLMDGALQTAIMTLQADKNKELYLPFSIGEIVIAKKVQEECYVYVTKTGSGRDYKKFDIELVDVSGNLMVSIKEFTVKAIVRKVNKDDRLKELLSKLELGELEIKQVEEILEVEKLC